MADKLRLFNEALRHLCDHKLASLTEDHPARHAIDGAWQDAGDTLLRQGFWNFALRTAEISSDEDVEALFGYSQAFSKPADWVRTLSVATDGSFAAQFDDYADEGNYWYASAGPLYVRYVSDETDYGWNVGAWPPDFARAIAVYLAFQCGLPVSGDKGNRNDLHNLYRMLLREARTRDAVDERVIRQKPKGRLAAARLGRSRAHSRNDA
jgi:hypothetical protein